MAAKARVKQTIKTRQKKVPSGSVQCNMCGGKGYHKKRK